MFGIRTMTEQELRAVLTKANYRGLKATARALRRELVRRSAGTQVTRMEMAA